MIIPEVCNLLKKELFNNHYEYGFYLNGKKYKPDTNKGFDEKYFQLSKTIYHVQDPIITIREKTGTCIDVVLVMKKLLDERGIPNKIWLLHNKSKGSLHTILTFEAECKIVYLELTPQSSKPFYGKEIIYGNEQTFISEYRNNGYDISDVTSYVEIDRQPDFLLTKLK